MAKANPITKPTESHTPHLDQLAISAGKIVAEWRDVDDGKLADLLNPIEDEAPRHRSATPRAALFQLLLAAGDLHELNETQDHDEEALHARYKRIIACVESAIDFFEVDADLDRAAFGGEYYAPRRHPRPSALAD